MGDALKEIFKPTNCRKCGEHYTYKAFGEYLCPNCGYIELDEFGKIRKYLEENGPEPAITISMVTKIPVTVINEYLREGRLEIPEESEIFITCEKCDTEIRYGRYCPACAAKLSKQLMSALMPSEIGEVPKRKGSRMHYLDSERIAKISTRK